MCKLSGQNTAWVSQQQQKVTADEVNLMIHTRLLFIMRLHNDLFRIKGDKDTFHTSICAQLLPLDGRGWALLQFGWEVEDELSR